MGSSPSIRHGGHVFFPEVVTPIYSEIAWWSSRDSLSESVNVLRGPNYSKIVTRMNGISGADKDDVSHASCASPSITLAYQDHSVGRRTCLIGF